MADPLAPTFGTKIRVELARVRDGDVEIRGFEVDRGSTLAQALAVAVAQGLVEAGRLGTLTAGVFGRVRAPDELLHDGDRIELTAGLLVDPKVARQRRVAKRRAADPRNMWTRER